MLGTRLAAGRFFLPEEDRTSDLGVGLVLQSLLIGIRPIDPIAFGTALLSLMAVLCAASWVPARLASLLDPMRALRSE